MSLASLTRTEFATRRGPLALWHPADAFRSARPLLLTITDAFASPDAMTRLPGVIGAVADVAIARLPGTEPASLWAASVGGFAEAIGEVVGQAFAHRPVVLLGLGMGGVVAMSVQAAPVRRIVAVEPLLVTGALWPLRGRLRDRLLGQPDDRRLADFLTGVFGVGAQENHDRRYRMATQAVAPIDVIVGSIPLQPPRTMDRLPSLVDEPERELLTDRPGVRLHVADGAGHNVPAEAPALLGSVLAAACKAAAAGEASDATVDQALVARVPLDARRVLYAGRRIAAFAGALLRRAPQVEVTDEATDAPVDVLVLEDLAGDELAPRLDALRPDGLLIAFAGRGASGSALSALDRDPLTLVRAHAVEPVREPFDDRATNFWPAWRTRPPERLPTPVVALARRAAPASPATRPLDLCLMNFATRVLDVRTRLPAQGLRSDPDLQVACFHAPAALPTLPAEAPKVLVLQRPALSGVAAWRAATAGSLRAGWVVVMEYDDHPDLVAGVAGRPTGQVDRDRFGYVHAVQTSTPHLAEILGRHNPEVKVFRNAAFALEPFPAQPRPPRVVYGAVNRGAYSIAVARSLAAVSAEFADLEYLVIGDRAVFDALPTARKRFVDYARYEDYLDLLGGCAISLSPLEDGSVNAAKSDVKFVEAAARGVLTIASPAAYGDTIQHGRNGLLAPRIEDWAPQLAAALRDEAARQAMARRAWETVRDERMFAHQLADRRAWYRSLWDRREELTRGLTARLPGLAEAMGDLATVRGPA